VRIYSRNFYVRQSQHDKLVEERQREIEELASKPKVNLESYNILVQRLEKELAEILKEYAQEVDFRAFHEIVMRVGRFDPTGEGVRRRLEEVLTQLWLVMA
jgi:restriction endonuclease Mrr